MVVVFYTYLWLREDGTPYYVGKGTRHRAYSKHVHNGMKPPPKSRIVVQSFETEADSLEAEKFLIGLFGRKDIGTGCLRNMSEGGTGAIGTVRSEETKRKIRNSKLGKKRPKFSKEWRQ